MKDALTEEQLAAIRPYAIRFQTQLFSEGSKSSDGGLTLESTEVFPGAVKVHVWQIGGNLIIDIVKGGGQVNSIPLKPQELKPA